MSEETRYMNKTEALDQVKKMTEVIDYCDKIIAGENPVGNAQMIKLTALQYKKYAEYRLEVEV